MVNPFRLRGRHSHHHSYRLHEKPPIERHFVSVISSALSIILLVLALSMKVWAKGTTPACTIVFGLTSVAVTHVTSNATVTSSYSMTGYYIEQQQILISCVISVAVLTILSSIVASAISMGYPREKMEFLRHFSVFNVVSLLCTVLVSGLWLAVVERLPQGIPTLHICNLNNMPVVFGYCYYIVLVAALFSLGASTYNLLCSRKAADRRRRLRNRLRQQQRRLGFDPQFLANQRELIGIVPPNYVVVENPLNHLEEEEETSLEQSEQDDSPLTQPPVYTL